MRILFLLLALLLAGASDACAHVPQNRDLEIGQVDCAALLANVVKGAAATVEAAQNGDISGALLSGAQTALGMKQLGDAGKKAENMGKVNQQGVDTSSRVTNESAQETAQTTSQQVANVTDGAANIGASSAINKVKLEKQLASEEQLGQLSSGNGTVISQPAKQAQRIAKQTGRDSKNIQKVSSDARTTTDGQHIQTHSFRDASDNALIEPKTIIDPKEQ